MSGHLVNSCYRSQRPACNDARRAPNSGGVAGYESDSIYRHMLFAHVGGPLSIPNGTCGGTRIDSYDILRETHTFVLSGCTAYGGEGESCGGPVERETSCSTFYIVSGDIRRLNTIILLCCSGSS